MFSCSKEPTLYTEVPVKEEKSLLALLLPSIFRPAVAAKWPNPQTSIGKRCCKNGELIFWEIQDPGRANLVPLKEEIQKFLDDHNEHHTEDSKRTEAANLVFDIFMVGRSEEESNPTLVIIDTDSRSRSKVVNSLRKIGIVEKYEGVMLGVSSRHPRYPEAGPVEWTAKEKGNGEDNELTQDCDTTPLAASETLEKEKNSSDPPAKGPEELEAHEKALLPSDLPGSNHKTTQDVGEPAEGSEKSSPERRGRDKDRRAKQASARLNEYFVPKAGIDREVITADICRYLGDDALVRPGNYENPQTRQIQQGYFITASRNLTTAMIADLKADSERWEAERRASAARAPRNDERRASRTMQSWQYYGPTSVNLAGVSGNT